jgi:rod shape-determining protein MreD
MTRSPSQPLQPLTWLGLPMLLAMAATILFAIPLRIFTFALPEPIFAMALAFAWPVIRPSILGPFALLLMGLFLDLFWGGPMGLWPLSLLLAYSLILMSRNLMVGQGPEILFGWYLAATGLAMGCAYFATLVTAGGLPNALGAVWQYLVTAALFPVAYRLIERFEDADVRFR